MSPKGQGYRLKSQGLKTADDTRVRTYLDTEQKQEYPYQSRDDTADKTHFLVAEQIAGTYSA